MKIQSKDIQLVDVSSLVFNPKKRNYQATSDGQILFNGKPMCQRPGGSGKAYLRVQICRKDYYIHRLILEAFIGPQPKGMQACHNDGNPKNNNISNLRWDTPKRNSHDKIVHGTSGKGSTNAMSKISETDWLTIVLCYQLVSSKMLASRFGLIPATITAIAMGRIRFNGACARVYRINKEVAQERIAKARKKVIHNGK